MLKFKVKSQKATLGKRKGQTLHFAKQVPGSRMTLRMVEEDIVKRTSLARGDVRNAIASLAEVVNEALLRGQIVDLGDLGSFQVTANGKYMDSEQEVDASTIKRPSIRHYPRAEMKRYAQAIQLSVTREGRGQSAVASGQSASTTPKPSTEDEGEYL